MSDTVKIVDTQLVNDIVVACSLALKGVCEPRNVLLAVCRTLAPEYFGPVYDSRTQELGFDLDDAISRFAAEYRKRVAFRNTAANALFVAVGIPDLGKDDTNAH